ncbi:amino acid permease [Microbacterium azadirachtae]|uniref:Putative amino acid permease YhdG n=1 Tax=Microbacterium azadirachtae TaxID=582680 RepID=A0A0F0LGD5_9MICO|nr:amino acid permease [Microbacterium azadirachtae]KJL32282.1 putative amino acid permease YhdG [Microbacterium azadirachtae]
MTSIAQQLLRRKPIAREAGDSPLRRTIGLLPLMAIGISCTIGTGIFFIMSQAVPLAGPAVVWSFVIAGIVAGLTALCYAELAGAVPVSGSTYSYAYATLGEGIAMVVGACLLLEYAVSAGAVAVGWSQYVNELIGNLFGLHLPAALSNAPEEGGIVNLPAVILVALCAVLLVRGTKESVVTNAVMVCIKIAVLLFFIAVGMTGWNSDHFANFAPYGIGGIAAGAGVIFFSFVGLDAVSTAGEEAKNPKRNLPLAILLALAVVIVLYVGVALVSVGAQAAGKFDGQEAGLSEILAHVVGSPWPGTVLAAGAVISIFSVTLVTLYGQTRILFAMSRDGMVPPIFGKVNERTRTPVQNTIIVSAVVAVLAGVIPISFLAEMTSIGTLAAFLVVSVGLIILRRREPDLERGFKVPLYPITPLLSIAGCLWIITQLRPVTIFVFAIWVALFLAFYFFYGRRRSVLQPGNQPPGADVPFTSVVRQPGPLERSER